MYIRDVYGNQSLIFYRKEGFNNFEEPTLQQVLYKFINYLLIPDKYPMIVCVGISTIHVHISIEDFHFV